MAGAWLLTQTIDVPSVDSLSALSARVRRHCCCQHRRPITAAWSIGTTTVFVLPGYWSALALVRSGAGPLWRWSALALVHSGAGPLSRSSTLFGGRSILFLFWFILHRITCLCPHTLILVSRFLLHLVASCPPLLGGYGALTRGVYQHLDLNGIFKNNCYRPLSMPCAILQRCRHSRCCLCAMLEFLRSQMPTPVDAAVVQCLNSSGVKCLNSLGVKCRHSRCCLSAMLQLSCE